MDITTYDVSTLKELILEQALSVQAICQQFLDKIHRLDVDLHAFCTLDDASVMQQALQLDVKRHNKKPLGPLFGVPIAIKDLLYTNKLRTTFGSALYQDFIPEEDDIVVARLRAADAIILGKTNTTEFGYSAASHNRLFPPTRNPWDLSRTSGGSSAGSAAAVASALCPAALGTDGGCSIRLPASFCGIVGFKPSFGVVPAYPASRVALPGISSWETLQVIGPMSRTVNDAALLMRVLAGADPRDRWSGSLSSLSRQPEHPPVLKGKRIGLSLDLGYLDVDPEIQAVVYQAAKRFAKESGVHLETIDNTWPHAGQTFSTLVILETDVEGLQTLISNKKIPVSGYLKRLLRVKLESADYHRALRTRTIITHHLQTLMTRYDFILTPVTGILPFPAEEDEPLTIQGKATAFNDWFGCCYPFNITGQPAISLPAGKSKTGLPIGLQLVGNRLCDAELLQAARVFEAISPWGY